MGVHDDRGGGVPLQGPVGFWPGGGHGIDRDVETVDVR